MSKAIPLIGSISSMLLLACAPPAEPQAPADAAAALAAPEPAAAAPAPAAAAEEVRAVLNGAAIAGAWDVVSFEGYRPARLRGTHRAAYADFGPSGVSLRMECNYTGRGGTVSNGRFIPPREGDGLQTAMSCGPERNARESRYFSFFEKSPTLEHLGADRLRLRAGESELVLERPAVRRLNFLPAPSELEGKWRMLELTRYVPEGGYRGSGLSEVPGRIVISGDRLTYNRCPQYALTFRLTADGRLQKIDGTAPADGARDCRELSGPPPGPEMPGPADVLALLHASPAVERTGEGALLLSSGRLGLLITRAPCESLEQSNDHRSTRITDCASPE
jgi:hypothetical protein